MSGVNILTTREIIISTIFNWTAFWITFTIGFVTILGISIAIKKVLRMKWMFVVLMTINGVLFGGLLGTVVGGAIFGVPNKVVLEHEVTISDEILMNEFTEKYEILGQDGEVYTVRER